MCFHRLACFAVLFLATAVAPAQELTPSQQYTITNGALGKDFWIAIPPNELVPYSATTLNVYVASAFDTEITINDFASGRTIKRSVRAGEVLTLSDATGETSWVWEIREFETVISKGIHITSEHPVTVSVVNAKRFSSDGYLALPTGMWSTDYVVTSYYDFKEARPWAGGFTVIAGEDNTRVTIDLRGRGGATGETSGGRKINTGTPYTFFMNAGQVYTVVGNGETRGEFDLTGTLVTSTKPIGLISSHMRTTVPNVLVNGNGRDHLVEMNAPLEQWDSTYVTVEVERNGPNPNGRGDLFRVIAAEDGTNWTMKAYDVDSKQIVMERNGQLNAGQFAELDHVSASSILPYGLTVWEANKPIQVVQYSCSASFDGDQVHDPFQLNLLSAQRFATSALFQLPTDEKFVEHYVNLVFIADPDDPETTEKLKAVTIDNTPIWNHPDAATPTLLNTNIDGTPYWWARIRFGNNAGAHTILSPDVPFGGYIYGFGSVDSYGYPVGPLNANVVASDTSSPGIVSTADSTEFAEIQISEKTNVPEVVRPEPLPDDQVDAGIADVGLLSSVNMRLDVVSAPGERRSQASEGLYRPVILDSTLDASARLYALDYAGNTSYLDLQYTVPRYPELTAPSSVDLGETGVDTVICSTDQVALTNVGNDTLVITGLEVQQPSSGFYLNEDACVLPIQLAPSDSLSLSCVCFLASASGSYGGSLLIQANDRVEPHLIVLSATVRETVTVSVKQDGDRTENPDVYVVHRADGSLMLYRSTTTAGEWGVYDLLGRRILSGLLTEGLSQQVIPTNGVGSGTFILAIDQGDETHSLLIAPKR